MKAVNLLPTELRGAAPAPAKPAAVQHSGGSGAYVVLGALALSVAGLAGWVLTGNSIEQREAELAAIAERQQAAQARAAQLKPYADFAAVATERLSTVQQLAGSRFRWELALRDISYALPTDVTVKSVDGSIATGSGGTSPLRGAIASPAVELTGCATDQRSVARMMARLRAVNGVTRVSLSRSDKGEQTESQGAVAPVTGGAGPQPQGCAGENPPDFELVMFFESQAALSAEPTLTSTSQAGAQPATGATTPATATETPSTDPAAAATPAPTPAATSSTVTPTTTEGAVTP